MNFVSSINRLIPVLLLPAMLVMFLSVGGGCVKKVELSDEAEREHPDMKKARELEAAGDTGAAKTVYEFILGRDPFMARAHLDLAFLLDKAGQDYVGAIYHFRRYLALRPETEKKAMIEDHVRLATLALVGTVFTNQAAVLTRLGALEGENKTLKIRASNLEGQTVQLRAALVAVRAKYGVVAKKASQTVDHLDLPVTPPKAVGKMVKVENADTLKKMAARYYGDQGRWREIYDANKKRMKSPGDLRVGQMIYIPPKDKETTL